MSHQTSSNYKENWTSNLTRYSSVVLKQQLLLVVGIRELVLTLAVN